MLSASENFCKWTLLGLLVSSLFLPVILIVNLDLLHTTYVFDALLFIMLVVTTVQAIPGLIGWFMLHRFDERGKKVLSRTYLTTLAVYSFYSVFLQITLLFPGTFYIFPFDIVCICYLLFFNVAVFVLKHFWTRDVY